jgi:hypothetical protein
VINQGEMHMLSADQIVSSWLAGSDVVAGMANPAGSVLVGGLASANGAEGRTGILQTMPIYCDVSVSTGTCG